MDAASILFYAALGLLLLLACGALCAPVRFCIRLLINACFGVAGLVVAGVFGGLIGVSVPVNVLSVALTVLLGMPGVFLVMLLHILL